MCNNKLNKSAFVFIVRLYSSLVLWLSLLFVFSPPPSSPSGSYASSAELSRCSSQLSEEDYGGEYGERDPYDENDSYHSCHSSVSYSKGSPDWDPDETQGQYSDEGGYSKDGGEEAALYEEEDGGLYDGEEEGLYEDEEMMYDDEDLYNLDGTLSEDMEPPFTPTPTSTAPPSLDVTSSRPPLEKQPSLHQQQPPAQPPNQAPNQSNPPGMAPSAQPPTGQPTTQPPKVSQPQTQPQAQAPPSATSFFSMAKPLTAAVTGLASTFLSSVPAAQPAQSQPPASAAPQPQQPPAASSVPPSHPATMANSVSQPPSTAAGPPSQQTPSSGQPQPQPNGPTTTQSEHPEDQDLQLEEEPWLEEEIGLEKEARTPPAQTEEKLPEEETEEHFKESRPPTPEEEKEMPPER